MLIKIIHVTSLSTIQDSGRFGFQKFGMPTSGSMDWYAFQAANRLVGNPPESALVEFSPGEMVIQASQDCLVAVTGYGYQLRSNRWSLPAWTAILLRQDEMLEVTPATTNPGWGYMAISGEFQSSPVLNSYATELRSKIGGLDGTPLKPGDIIPITDPANSLYQLAGRRIPQEGQPDYNQDHTIEVIPGPDADYFDLQELNAFYRNTYQVSYQADRMGYRLEGPPLKHKNGADILSSGLVKGSIQVPANGQPIVMMSDHPTTGGYPRIATVITADLPLLAQTMPGTKTIRFKPTNVEQARLKLIEMIRKLDFYFPYNQDI